jgi:hypothetical protein
MLIAVRTPCVGGEAMVFATEKSGQVGEKVKERKEEEEKGDCERAQRLREHERKA